MRTKSPTTLMLLGSISLFAFGATGAVAASVSEQICTSDGGSWDKPTKTCTHTSTDTAGKSDTKWTSETTDTAHGNLKNDQSTTDTTCIGGPGGSKPAPHC
jgi:hypothetical protein